MYYCCFYLRHTREVVHCGNCLSNLYRNLFKKTLFDMMNGYTESSFDNTLICLKFCFVATSIQAPKSFTRHFWFLTFNLSIEKKRLNILRKKQSTNITLIIFLRRIIRALFGCWCIKFQIFSFFFHSSILKPRQTKEKFSFSL